MDQTGLCHTATLRVTKRDGRKEYLDLDKIHRVLDWASHGLTQVSVSEVELKAQLQFSDSISTTSIHEMLIKAAADLISEKAPDYQYFAARLSIFHLRKRVFGQFKPPSLHQHIARLVDGQRYDPAVFTQYSPTELDHLDSCLDHNRDLSFSYAAVKQLEGKYLVQDRVTGQIFETPQFLYMLVSMFLFAEYPPENRLDYVQRFYDAISTFKLSLPTPIMAGVRTQLRQFSSCVLIECDDSLDSINATAGAILKYVSQRAGIGVNSGRIRALGSPIRSGEAYHTGSIPFYKHFQTAVKSCSQGGVRGGAATLFFPLWHLEIESLLVLKNNRGVDENRARHLDYAVQLNKLMYERLLTDGNITLFSPSDVPGLYEKFFIDQDAFSQLYCCYEADESIRKKTIKALDLFSMLMRERAGTGRLYIQNVDHCNTHSAFNPEKAPIRQSNLCLEITLPTKPLKDLQDPEGEIALCTLAAFNLGAIETLDEVPHLADLIVRALDSLIDYQNYPVLAAETLTKSRRSLGIGVVNFAYYLAKNGKRYSDGSANILTHETFEAIQYHLLKASCALAAETMACSAFSETTYAQGLLPIDTYKKAVDEYCPALLKQDWETLRTEIAEHGLRHSTLTALMPSETSSQISNSTNGIEPPRGFVSVKTSKDGILKQVVPEFKKLRENYELLWNMPSNEGYLQLVSIMQKFVDQSISANTNYDPGRFSGNKVPMRVLLRDLITSYRYGLKTLYYHNTRDGAGKNDTDSSHLSEICPGDGCTL